MFADFATITDMSAHLSRIAITNYRSFYQTQSISFDVSSANTVALFGKNAVGKSNVLKALRTLVEVIIHSSDADYKLPFNPFHYADRASLYPTTFDIEVKDDRRTVDYTFSYNAREIIQETLRIKSEKTNKYKILFSRNGHKLASPSSANYGFSQKLLCRTLPRTLLLTKAYEDNNIYAKFVFDAINRIEFVSMESGRLVSKVAAILNNKPNIRNSVLKELSRIEPSIKNIKTSSTSLLSGLLGNVALDTDLLWKLSRETYVNVKIVRRYGAVDYEEDIGDESSGTRALLVILTMLQYAADNDLMLCMDEFGNYIHQINARRMIEFYNSLNPTKKFFITTHQISMYDYIGRTDRIMVGKDDKTGETYLKQLRPTSSARRKRNDKVEAENYFSGLIRSSQERGKNDYPIRVIGLE